MDKILSLNAICAALYRLSNVLPVMQLQKSQIARQVSIYLLFVNSTFWPQNLVQYFRYLYLSKRILYLVDTINWSFLEFHSSSLSLEKTTENNRKFNGKIILYRTSPNRFSNAIWIIDFNSKIIILHHHIRGTSTDIPMSDFQTPVSGHLLLLLILLWFFLLTGNGQSRQCGLVRSDDVHPH